MIKKHEVKTYIEHLYCDKCMVEMRWISVVNTIGVSVDYEYRCPCCGKTVTLDKGYPRTVTEEQND